MAKVLCDSKSIQFDGKKIDLPSDFYYTVGLYSENTKYVEIWAYAQKLARERGINFEHVASNGKEFIFYTGINPTLNFYKIPRQEVEAITPKYAKFVKIETSKNLSDLETTINDLKLPGIKAIIVMEEDVRVPAHQTGLKIVLSLDYDLELRL